METMVKKQPVEPVIPVIEVDALPNDWALKTIGEICEKVEKIDPAAAPNAEIQYIDISGINNKLLRIVDAKTYLGKDAPSRARQLVKANDVVISTVRTYLKNIALVPDELDGQVASTGFCVLRAADPWMGRYLYYFVQSEAVLKEIGKQQRGTSYPAVRDSDIKAQFVPVPPKKDAKRIVSAIELQLGRLDAAVARLHAAKAKLKRYKQAVLKAAVEGAFLYPELEQNELPTGWQVASLGELVEDPRYGTSKKCGADAKGVPVLRIPNIGDGIVSQADLKYASFDAKERKAYELREGDLLTIRSNGSVDLVGKCALIREVDEHFLYAGYLIRLRPKRDLAEPRFLLYHLSSLPSRVEIESKAKSTSGVNNINAQELKDLTITLPPLKDQVAICDKVEVLISEMNALETTLDTQLAQSTRLRQSVLKRAFEGRLV